MRRRGCSLALLLLIFLASAPRVQAGPPGLPSSFWGSVEDRGGALPEGTIVEALVDGRVCGEGRIRLEQGETMYAVHVLADDTDTPEKDGGREGDAVAFRICGTLAEQGAIWHGGTNSRVDLTLAAGTARAVPAEEEGMKGMARSGRGLFPLLGAAAALVCWVALRRPGRKLR